MAAHDANQMEERESPLPRPRRVSANKALLVVLGALLVALLALLVTAMVNYSGAQRQSPAPTQPAPADPVDESPQTPG